MSVIKLPRGDGTWEALKIPNVDAISRDHNTYEDFNIGFNSSIIWKSVVTPFTNKPIDMTQSTGYIPVYMPYEGSADTGIQVVYGTVSTDMGKIWMRRCDTGTWSAWALVAGEEMEKATGTDVNTGTDDAKFVTSKAIEDSNLIRSTDGSISDVIYVTKAEYEAMTAEEKANKTIMVDEFSSGMAIYDSLPIGSIVEISGDTPPDGWTEFDLTVTYPTLSSGWLNYGSGYSSFGYYKDRNRVYLTGLVKTNALLNGATYPVFTLPTGYRPIGNRIFISTCSLGYADTRVGSNGAVAWNKADIPSDAWVSFDGISFEIE